MDRDFVKFFNFLKKESRRTRKALVLFNKLRNESLYRYKSLEVKSVEPIYLPEIALYSDDSLKKAFEVFNSIILPEHFNFKDKLDILFCDILLITLEIVKNPRVPELLQRLTRESRSNLIAGFILFKDERSFTSYLTRDPNFSLLSILELLEESNETEVDIVGNLYDYRYHSESPKMIEDIQKYGEFSSKFLGLSGRLSVSKFSNFLDEFHGLVHPIGKDFIKRINIPNLTTLLLLRKLHGEDIVIDVLKRINIEGIEWVDCDVIRFVREWDEIKDYPLSWTLSMLESENSKSPLI